MDNDEKIRNANEYFKKRTKTVYIDRCSGLGIETFKEYLDHRYRDCCYDYSFYALMGLKPNDTLLRGYIDVSECGVSNYHHGWVEFTFEDEQYVFDNHFRNVVLKNEWYEARKPVIDYQKTQEEILEKIPK